MDSMARLPHASFLVSTVRRGAALQSLLQEFTFVPMKRGFSNRPSALIVAATFALLGRALADPPNDAGVLASTFDADRVYVRLPTTKMGLEIMLVARNAAP
jgi:hypothetical protein